MNRKPNKKDSNFSKINIQDMAKYKSKKTVSKEDIAIDDSIIVEKKDPLRDKILALRAKGFNNARIAATLMIHKQTVDKI
jgi:hypothetical protein